MDLNKDSIVIPAKMFPGFRTSAAVETGVERNLLLTTWGGIGDQVCAEPTLRYALEQFGKDVEISLATHIPEMFRHLKFKEVFDLNKVKPVEENYLVFHTIAEQNDLSWQFLNHCIINCVDYPSLSAFKCTLPIKAKEVKLVPRPIELPDDVRVVVHPGKHWPTKTFPKSWWDELLTYLLGLGFKPIIIGKNMEDNRGTVDVCTDGCLDLRDKLDLNGLAHLLQNAHVILTNDSSPIHIGASGSAFIGYVATCKHPDYLTHWRKGEWGWRMKNFGRGGIWENLSHLPNHTREVTVDNCEPEQLKAWLPEPIALAEWTIESSLAYAKELRVGNEELN